MRHLAVGCGLALLVLAAGCNRSDSTGTVVPLQEVPAPLMKIAREKLPDVSFSDARKKSDGSFEIRGKTRTGKVREIELSSAGEVLDIE